MKIVPKGMWMALLSLAVASEAPATVLVYVPVNPAFGGSPLNGPTLLNTAQGDQQAQGPGINQRTAQQDAAAAVQ